MKKICILGMGYIGFPTACMFATHGIRVVGVDINQEVVDILNKGNVHIQEPGLEAIAKAAIQSGNLFVTNHPEYADAFIIAVPTPFQHCGDVGNSDDENIKKADMSFVISAAESIAPYLQKGNLVVLESTSPPQTTVNLLKPIFERTGLKAGEDFYLTYSPERVLPGQILKELVGNARVIGGVNCRSAEAGRDLYSIFVEGDIILTDATTAEMVKLMENTYRDINIAIANEFSRLADRFGIDVWKAIEIANRHPRVKILTPGPGVGGHCISVDPWFLIEAAPDLSKLIYAARNVNDSQPKFFVDLVKGVLGSLESIRIAILGLSFKPNVDDLRESPAIEIAEVIRDEGAQVVAYEPYKTSFQIPGVQPSNSLEEAVRDAQAILFLVNHDSFKKIDPFTFAKNTSSRIIIDAVNLCDRAEWEKAGFMVYKLGVSLNINDANSQRRES